MKTKLLLSAVALALCAPAPAAFAQGHNFTSGRGLNGTDYVSPTYLWSNNDTFDYSGAGFRLNKSLRTDLDLIATAGFTRSQRVAGSRADSRDFDVGVRLHTTAEWGRPFMEATVGYNWWKYAGFKDNTFTWAINAGAELQLTDKLSIAPLVGYADATEYGGSGEFYGVLRTNLWINDRWSLRANFSYSEDGHGLGAGFAWAF
jgi:opacity protein-like surface antigen